MATYYLFDMHVPVLADARLVDVVSTTPSASEIRVDGLTPIKVPDGVRVVNPTSLTDLLTQKYAGILASYPGFGSIVYDDLLDGSGVEAFGDLSTTGARGSVGGHVATSLSDPNASLPVVASQCILVTEEFTWRYVEPKNGRIERYYVEEPTSFHEHALSVDGGAHFSRATSGSVISFVPGEQGSLIQIRFFNFNNAGVNDRVYHVGSWAVLY